MVGWAIVCPAVRFMVIFMRLMNENFMDALSLVSFAVSMENLQQNLTQNDKDDLMGKLDEQTRDVLGQIHEELEEQNRVLRDISSKLDEVLYLAKKG